MTPKLTLRQIAKTVAMKADRLKYFCQVVLRLPPLANLDCEIATGYAVAIALADSIERIQSLPRDNLDILIVEALPDLLAYACAYEKSGQLPEFEITIVDRKLSSWPSGKGKCYNFISTEWTNDPLPHFAYTESWDIRMFVQSLRRLAQTRQPAANYERPAENQSDS